MEAIDWILDKLFWAIVGGVSTAIAFKAQYTCAIGVCVWHQFNLMSAFGL